MSVAVTGVFSPYGEAGGPVIDITAATVVVEAVIEVTDWQLGRKKEELKLVYDLFKQVAGGAVKLAENIWDALNSPPAPADTQGRPIGAPDPGVGSLFVKARPGGNYYLRFYNNGVMGRREPLGSSDRAYVVTLVNNPNGLFAGHSGPYVGGISLDSFSTDPNTGVLFQQTHLVGEGEGSAFNWQEGTYIGDPPTYEIFFGQSSLDGVVVSDLDPFVGPVPGTSTPVRRKPIVTPIPTVQPATVPFPNPQPQPERKVAPPSPAPQPQPTPQTFPDQNPVTPQPATTPTTTPAPFVPVVVPQVTPNRTTQTNADGSRQTAVLPRAITTPVGNERIGPVTITTNAPQATLAGIAGEVGRIEQKLAKMINNTSDDWKDTAFGYLLKGIEAVLENFATGQPAGAYILSSPCEKLPNGERVEYQVPILSTNNRFDAIYERLDALADLIQTHKDLKQPICRGAQPTGQPVTVNFTQIE